MVSYSKAKLKVSVTNQVHYGAAKRKFLFIYKGQDRYLIKRTKSMLCKKAACLKTVNKITNCLKLKLGIKVSVK
jgi:hypothetical protein